MKTDRQSTKPTLVIGAGIIGASIAYHLAKRNVEVVIVDRVGTAAGASGQSFAWINAHHVKDEGYHRLRYLSLMEYHRLERELDGSLGVQWCGALAFDALGESFDQRVKSFQQLGYPADVVSHNRFRELEPHYGHPPGRALHLSLEAALEPARACDALIRGAVDKGARTLFGSDVLALRQDHGRIIGIETSHGKIDAEHVVMASGVGAEAILKSADVTLPMANRSGVIIKTQPIEPRLNHVIWGDRIHLKQQADGRLVIGEIFSDNWTDRDPQAISEQMLADAGRHIPDVNLVIEHMTIGLRPIPKDGMPVIGAVDGRNALYVAVMHSGITLAPVVGRLVAEEIVNDVKLELLEPYRLSRFQDDTTKAAS